MLLYFLFLWLCAPWCQTVTSTTLEPSVTDASVTETLPGNSGNSNSNSNSDNSNSGNSNGNNGNSPEFDEIRGQVNKMTKKMDKLSGMIEKLNSKQKSMVKLFGLGDLTQAGDSATTFQTDFHQNISEMVGMIETRFQHLLASLSTVSPSSTALSGLCTWSHGLPEELQNTFLGPLQVQVGSSLLSCKPDEDGWISIMRRIDGTVNFARYWDEYKHGFGNPHGNFWLGNEVMHTLTNARRFMLNVTLTSWRGYERYASYEHFLVTDELDKYRMYVGGYSGDAGDALSYHNSIQFSTLDQDNDNYNGQCVAGNGRGGWWFDACDKACLTGNYFTDHLRHESGVEWTTAFRDARSFKLAEMKIMPVPGGLEPVAPQVQSP